MELDEMEVYRRSIERCYRRQYARRHYDRVRPKFIDTGVIVSFALLALAAVALYFKG